MLALYVQFTVCKLPPCSEAAWCACCTSQAVSESTNQQVVHRLNPADVKSAATLMQVRATLHAALPQDFCYALQVCDGLVLIKWI